MIDDGNDGVTKEVVLNEEQQKEKDKMEKQVSPETNATFTKIDPAPQGPQPGDYLPPPFKEL